MIFWVLHCTRPSVWPLLKPVQQLSMGEKPLAQARPGFPASTALNPNLCMVYGLGLRAQG